METKVSILLGSYSFIDCYCPSFSSTNSNFASFSLIPEASDISFYVNACFVIEVPNYSEFRGVSNLASVSVEVDAKPKAKAKAKKLKTEDSNERQSSKQPKAEAKKRKAADSDDSFQQPSKKKKKKAKDPNAPKRNLSAYIHYCNSTRDITKVLNPKMDFVKITKVLSANWKALSSHERALWDAKAAADKERYQRDLARYKETEQFARWQAMQAEGAKPAATEPAAPNPADSESVSDENSKKKQKKRKKIKDPNAPKKNITAFMHFSKDTRKDVKASQPDLTFGEIAKVISVNWKALSDQQRAVWDEKAATDKVRFQKELAEYQDSQSTDQDVVEAKMPAKKN